MIRGVSTSRHSSPKFYSAPPLLTSAVESRYAPFSIGITDAAGGLFIFDTDLRQIGWRAQVPNAGTPSVLWIYCSTVGAVGGTPESLSIRLCKGLVGDPWQPDTSEGVAVEWFIPAASAAGWIAVPLVRAALVAGDVIHVFMQVQSGGLSGARSVSFPSVKSRFPLQHGHRTSIFGTAVRDDYSAMMYAPDSSDLANNPYAEQKAANTSYHPIWFLQFSDAVGFGNPFDVIDEQKVFGVEDGPNSFALNVLIPYRLDLNFIAINMRGSGSGNTEPAGDLFLRITDSLGATVHGPKVFVSKTARLFQGRPHWFGYQPRGETPTLRAENRYNFKFMAPDCADAYANDSYLLTLVASTLSTSVFNGESGTDTYTVNQGGIYNPAGPATTARFGFMLRTRQEYEGPFSVIDEFLGGDVNKAHAGATVSYAGLSRNIGNTSDGIYDGEMFVRLRDATTGLPPPGYNHDVIITGPLSSLNTPSLARNNEHTGNNWVLSFIMPSTDIHLKIETGHAARPGSLRLNSQNLLDGGYFVIDDWSPIETRVY